MKIGNYCDIIFALIQYDGAVNAESNIVSIMGVLHRKAVTFHVMRFFALKKGFIYMFDWEKFRKRELVVNCRTKEAAKNFISTAVEKGFNVLISKESLLECWADYEEKTCFVYGDRFLTYDGRNTFEEKKISVFVWPDAESAAEVNEPLPEGKTLLERIIDHYGEKAQMIVAIEEMAELTKALTKDMRGSINKDHVTEEMADVYICLEQLKIIHGISEESLSMWKKWKLERTEQKLKEVQGE